ncbi:acyltransferase family protein [Babesia divergens]|uniref:Acyltransferase family protein n=1 Tax=Babesia divergens TaxID=32595 RepID=A0AAD9LJ87_BABDI|nr:acyltransferase family protein [Babesia divergens]
MEVFEFLVSVLRSGQLYLIFTISYILSVIVLALYVILMLPMFLVNHVYVYKTINWIGFMSLYHTAMTCNYAWKCVYMNDPPKDSKKKGRVYMFNHLSAADPMVVSGLGLKVPLVYTYKDSVNKIPTVGPVMKFVGHHAIKFKYDKKNDRKVAVPESVKSLMQKCKVDVDNGFNIVVYPEGKRSRDGRLGEFKDGFFRFAIEHDVEILPCAISNSEKLWPMKTKFLIGKGVAYVNTGKPISPKGKTIEELKHVTRKAIYELIKQCPTFNPEVESVPELEQN